MLESSPRSNESKGSKGDQCGEGWKTLKEQEELPQSQKHLCMDWPQPLPVLSKGRKGNAKNMVILAEKKGAMPW